MGKGNKFEEIMLERLNSIESKLDIVRTEDIPNMRVKMAEDITALKKDVGNEAKFYSGAGSGLAIAIALLVGHFRK